MFSRNTDIIRFWIESPYILIILWISEFVLHFYTNTWSSQEYHRTVAWQCWNKWFLPFSLSGVQFFAVKLHTFCTIFTCTLSWLISYFSQCKLSVISSNLLTIHHGCRFNFLLLPTLFKKKIVKLKTTIF